MTTSQAPASPPLELAPARESAEASPRRRRWRSILVVVAVALVVVVALWVVLVSNLLAVSRVTVQGTTAQPHARVVEAAQVPLGTPLARVDTAAVAGRLQALPGVGVVEVRRTWPHELVLVVDDRVAVAAMRDSTGWVSVDAAGSPILPIASPGTMPALIAPSEPLRALAAQVVAGLPAALARRVATVTARAPDSVILGMRDGDRVRWGSVERGERKAEVLLALLRQPGRIYDVTAPDFPAVIP